MNLPAHHRPTSNAPSYWRYVLGFLAVLFITNRLAKLIGGSQPGSKKFTYDFPRPALTVDTILVTKEVPPKVLLIQRDHEPDTGRWALPGGFVNENEPLEDAAKRELHEETSVSPTKMGNLVQVGTFGDPGRDPRGWIVGVEYAALVSSGLRVRAADDAAGAKWFSLDELPLPLAIDHAVILRAVFLRLAQEEEAARMKGLRQALLKAAEVIEKAAKQN